MRFVTFEHQGVVRAGVLEGDASGRDDVVWDLGDAGFRDFLDGSEPQIGALLSRGLSHVAKRLALHPWPDSARLPLTGVSLKAPLPSPPLILGIAHNYHDALAERGMAAPAKPLVFVKEPWTLIGTGEPVVLPAGIGGVTYEAELAVVLDRPARDVVPSDALALVGGYAAFNDVSASELIRAHGSLEKGKNIATFGPFGPYLATVDEVPDPQALRVTATVDGISRQDSSTAQMLFGVAELISLLSSGRTLPPGTVIATGTPAGVAPLQVPPTWLKPGSIVTVSVEGLGTLSNPIVEEGDTHGR